MPYDTNNIFAKIIRGDIPCKKLYEDDRVLAFHDIHPRRAVHVLIIPKGPYTDTNALDTAADADIIALMRAVPKVAEAAGVKETGYRLLTNTGVHGGQEVPHLHFHLLGGEPVGVMVS
jgi:histidine triad (HIT) family protein